MSQKPLNREKHKILRQLWIDVWAESAVYQLSLLFYYLPLIVTATPVHNIFCIPKITVSRCLKQKDEGLSQLMELDSYQTQ